MRLLLGLLVSCLAVACAGNRGAVKFDTLEYPVSMSAFVNGPNKSVLVKDDSLQVIQKFEFQKKQWAMMYSFVNLSDDEIFATEINKAIKQANGDALINLNVTSANCFINFGLFALPILPFYPGCSDVTVSGDIVVAKTKGKK